MHGKCFTVVTVALTLLMMIAIIMVKEDLNVILKEHMKKTLINLNQMKLDLLYSYSLFAEL